MSDQVNENDIRPDLRDNVTSSENLSRADATELTEELDRGVASDATGMTADDVQDLPQRAIDAGWRFASHGANADALSTGETQAVADIEVAYENTESESLIVGRGHSYTEAYTDALRQMGVSD